MEALKTTTATKTNKPKTLEELFNEPCCVAIERALMHQAFQLPNTQTESTLTAHRPGMKDLRMVFHPGYGLIGTINGKYFLTPSANMIVGQE